MNFSRKHSSYQEAAQIQAEVAKWTAELLPGIHQVDGPVLELGAGTGLFTRHLVKFFPQVVASDLSESMVREGKSAVPSPNWKVLDAWSLPNDSTFAGIVSSSLLQWCKDPLQVFQNWFDLLQPGGWMLHSFFLEGTLRELQQIAPDALAVKFRSSEDWVKAFKSAGFEVLKTDTREDMLRFSSAVSLFRNLHNLGATTPNKIQPTLLRRILKEYEAKFSSNQEAFAHWNSTRILCRKSI